MLGLSTSDIKIKIESEKDCVKKVSVEWPAAKVKEKVDAAFDQVKNQAKIPGFRPGKAPADLIKKSYTGVAYERAQDDLMREGVMEALKQKKINAVNTPVIQTADFKPEKAFYFEFEVEVSPVVKATGYKGLAITRKKTKPSDADLERTLKQIVDSNAKLTESKADTLANTHFAVVDYEGSMDGKAIEGAKAENFLIDMSAPQAITGLAEGLLGAKAGETRNVDVTFPENSPSKELAGKKASFKIKLNAIKEKQVPNLDDEFAKDLGVESLAELKKRVSENLEHELKQTSERDVRSQLVDKLLAKNEFALPPSLIVKQAEYLAARQSEMLQRQGFPKDEIKKLIDNMKAEIHKQAEREIRLQYVIDSLGEIEKIEVTEAEISGRINEILGTVEEKNRKASEEALRGRYLQTLRLEMRDNKVYDWLIKNAKVTEDEGAKK
jgi:trigger factor